jgi:hypothetical protein
MGTTYSALKQVAVGFTKRPEYVAFVAQCFAPLTTPILKEVFAILAKILGNVKLYLLCTLLKEMRFQSKRYLCWQRRQFPQRIT